MSIGAELSGPDAVAASEERDEAPGGSGAANG